MIRSLGRLADRTREVEACHQVVAAHSGRSEILLDHVRKLADPPGAIPTRPATRRSCCRTSSSVKSQARTRRRGDQRPHRAYRPHDRRCLAEYLGLDEGLVFASLEALEGRGSVLRGNFIEPVAPSRRRPSAGAIAACWPASTGCAHRLAAAIQAGRTAATCTSHASFITSSRESLGWRWWASAKRSASCKASSFPAGTGTSHLRPARQRVRSAVARSALHVGRSDLGAA